MKRVVRISRRVADFYRCLAPEPRKAVKLALTGLQFERGDIRALDSSLTGFCRLRVGRYRIIFAYSPDGTIDAIFMAERSLVYEVFEAEFIRRISGGHG